VFGSAVETSMCLELHYSIDYPRINITLLFACLIQEAYIKCNYNNW